MSIFSDGKERESGLRAEESASRSDSKVSFAEPEKSDIEDSGDEDEQDAGKNRSPKCEFLLLLPEKREKKALKVYQEYNYYNNFLELDNTKINKDFFMLNHFSVWIF